MTGVILGAFVAGSLGRGKSRLKAMSLWLKKVRLHFGGLDTYYTEL